MANRKIVLEHPAYKHLANAASQLAETERRPEAVEALVHNARSCVRSAMEVLLERDKLQQKLGMISLMLLESTTYTMKKIAGEMKELVEVTDDYMFSYAVRELHALPAKFRT